jgi:hypothetical protein
MSFNPSSSTVTEYHDLIHLTPIPVVPGQHGARSKRYQNGDEEK